MKLEDAAKETASGKWDLKVGLFPLGDQGRTGRAPHTFHSVSLITGRALAFPILPLADRKGH